jgi:hypothetical protein
VCFLKLRFLVHEVTLHNLGLRVEGSGFRVQVLEMASKAKVVECRM